MVNDETGLQLFDQAQTNEVEVISQRDGGSTALAGSPNPPKSPDYSRLLRYILNVRVIAVILANIWWNQIKILIRTRVQYDRDLFNYEEYRKKGMNDQRLIKNTLFMPS